MSHFSLKAQQSYFLSLERIAFVTPALWDFALQLCVGRSHCPQCREPLLMNAIRKWAFGLNRWLILVTNGSGPTERVLCHSWLQALCHQCCEKQLYIFQPLHLEPIQTLMVLGCVWSPHHPPPPFPMPLINSDVSPFLAKLLSYGAVAWWRFRSLDKLPTNSSGGESHFQDQMMHLSNISFRIDEAYLILSYL